ncbi:MAG: WYL domain-containing protein [Chitinophagales bacterium]
MGILDQWNKPKKGIKELIQEAIAANKHIEIQYKNWDGEFSTRTLSNIYINNKFEDQGYHNQHIKGFCSKRQEERTFKIDRIISVKILN